MSKPGERRGNLRVGTSGWQYKHWRGIFYPEKLPQKQWLEYYAQRFDTVEVNNTFYRLPREETFDDWRRRAPEGFLYVLKFSRYGTHLKYLADPEATLSLFLERAARLDPLLGPMLVQLPPYWEVNVERLENFLGAAPPERRWALEFRNATWLCEPVYRVLRRHNAALCIHDNLPDHPRLLTADWVYLRFHGDRDHAGDYPPQRLAEWAAFARRELAHGHDVYAYFNNDAQGYAIANALDLKRLIQGGRRSAAAG